MKAEISKHKYRLQPSLARICSTSFSPSAINLNKRIEKQFNAHVVGNWLVWCHMHTSFTATVMIDL